MKIIRKGHIVSITRTMGYPGQPSSNKLAVSIEEPGSTEVVAQLFLGIDELAGAVFGQAIKITVEST